MSADRSGNGERPGAVVDHAADLYDVRDQGRRGTCVAFATTTLHEHARRRLRGDASPVLSVELLFWRCKQLDGAPDGDGTDFHAARGALADPGQPAEALWPYDDSRDHTAASYAPPAMALEPARLRCATLRPLAAHVDALGRALRDGRLVVAGIELWDGFFECDGTVLAAPDDNLAGAGHAVCLVGWDGSRRTVKVRNSWGVHWGEAGYAWLGVDALQAVLREAWVVDGLDSA